MSKYLTRRQVLDSQGVRTAEVEVPEWDGVVLVRELMTPEVMQLTKVMFSGGGLEALGDLDIDTLRNAEDEQEIAKAVTQSGIDISAVIDMYPQIVVWSVVDEDLNQLFTQSDVHKFKSFDPVQRIAEKALELTGLGENESKN